MRISLLWNSFLHPCLEDVKMTTLNVFVVNPSYVERNGPVQVTLSRKRFVDDMPIVSCSIRKYHKV